MSPCIFVTLGPSSFNKKFVEYCTNENISLLRINLSHTPIESLEGLIADVQEWTDIPVCIDSEGAQIRNQSMKNDEVRFTEGSIVKLHYDEVIGDSENISFTPRGIVDSFKKDDRIRIDFDLVCLKVIEKNSAECKALVEKGGIVGSRKAVDLNRLTDLETITEKDKRAIAIGKKMGIRNFALSFSSSEADVGQMRELVGEDSNIISKIENIPGLLNLQSILKKANQILIDRGDLSRSVPIEKIPFLQRRIISIARSFGKPVHVATNLLESMVTKEVPTRAEVNDVISTLLMGANGLVLAAETAKGEFPFESVKMTKSLIDQYLRWTQNTTIQEILSNHLNT